MHGPRLISFVAIGCFLLRSCLNDPVLPPPLDAFGLALDPHLLQAVCTKHQVTARSPQISPSAAAALSSPDPHVRLPFPLLQRQAPTAYASASY